MLEDFDVSGVIATDEDMRFGNEQRRENEVVFLEETLHDF